MWRDGRFAGAPRWYMVPPSDRFMRIPDTLLKCVSFIYVRINNEPQYVGTAFLVSVPCEVDSVRSYKYVVTARHVAKDVKGMPFYFRVNTTDGKSVEIPAIEPMLANKFRWFYHPDPFVDVAVFPYDPIYPKAVLEWEAIPIHDFLTDDIVKKKDIGLGDEVSCVGLFSLFTGNKRNIPLARLGTVASLPPEPIPIKLDDKREGMTDAYLVEMKSMEKMSGSPVFVSDTHIIALTKLHLQKVNWDDTIGDSDDVIRAPGKLFLMGL